MKTKLIQKLAGAALALVAAAPVAAKLNSCDGPIVFGTTVSETGPFSTLADRWRKLTEVFAEEVNRAGGVICPPVPAFYQRPEGLSDVVDHSVARVLDLFDIETAGALRRWQGLRITDPA